MTPSSHPSIDELAAGEIDDIDIANLQRMQQMYERLDPAPSGLVDRISFGITLEALHAEIAEIQRVDGSSAFAPKASPRRRRSRSPVRR